jgi:septum site-determining protein MinC
MPHKPALELKGRMLSVTRIRIADADPAAAAAQLRAAGAALRGLPVVLEADRALDLPPLLAALREAGLQPLGVIDGVLADAAGAAGLAVLPDDAFSGARGAQGQAPAGHRPTRIIDVPVRSGQQIYAEGSDLIVTGVVGNGAEVIADGCVHVYGTLRGRALAGARGDETARVFCRRLEAELVAVAGVYMVAEQIPADRRGKPVQVVLNAGKLCVEKLDG